MSNNTLITGSSGFVGQNLVPYLLKSDLLSVSISRSELTTIKSEIISNCETIVHLAGKAHDLRKTSNPEEYYRVNFELTRQLYDAFLKSESKKFIYISSVKAVADSVEGLLTEEDIPHPKTDYGKSKLMAEEYIKQQMLPIGKSYYILRPCMIHGPGNKGNLNLLYKFVLKGIPYPLADFKNKRSFLSIENLCFVIRELIKRNDIPKGIYHVSDNEPLSTIDIVSILAKAIGKKPKFWAINTRFIKLIAKFGTILKLPFTTERLNKLTESYQVGNNKIKIALGQELPTAARDGLQVTVASFKLLS